MVSTLCHFELYGHLSKDAIIFCKWFGPWGTSERDAIVCQNRCFFCTEKLNDKKTSIWPLKSKYFMIQFDDIMWGYQGSPSNSWQVSDTLLWGTCPWRWYSSRSYRTTALTLPKIGSCHFSQLFGNIWLHFANVCSWELFQPFQAAHLDKQVGQITELKLPPCDPP